MADVRIILHGQKREPSDFDAALAAARRRHPDLEIVVQPTFEGKDARRLAVEACELGPTRIVAAGGDGTLHEVVSGMIPDIDCPLGILPLGTANDFAVAAGIPIDLEAAFDLALTAEPTRVDCGSLSDEPFLNLATGGSGPNITSETPELLKDTLGGLAYMVAAFKQVSEFGAIQARVVGDDFEWQGDLHAFAIGNGRLAGGGHQVCPDALIDDGLFDVAVLPELPEGQWVETLKLSMNVGWQALESEVLRWRSKQVHVELDSEIHLNLDGEKHHGDTFDFEVLPGKLEIIIPRDSPLLLQNEPSLQDEP